MPSSTASSFGAVCVIRWLIVSTPLTMYFFLQGLPNGLSVMQSCAIDENPMSFPPIVIETVRVDELRLLNCGGFGPSGLTLCAVVMWFVLAPEQLASFSDCPIRGAVLRG